MFTARVFLCLHLLVSLKKYATKLDAYQFWYDQCTVHGILDGAEWSRLRAAIGALENPPTTFVVSQRAASIRTADWILVLDDGRVVGQGTHEALLRTCEVYQEIYYSQFQKEVKRRVP